MPDVSIFEWIAMAVICLVAAVTVVSCLSPRGPYRRPGPGATNEAIWIFDGSDLVDSTALARKLINQTDAPCAWNDLYRELCPAYPTFPKSPHEVKKAGSLISPAPEGAPPNEILCEWIGGVTRVELRRRRQDSAPSADAAQVLSAAAHELETLRLAVDNAHYPVWRINDQGAVIWFNKAYAELCQTVLGNEPGPDTALFSAAYETPVPTRRSRRSVTRADSGKKLWFDISIVQHKSGTLIYGVDVNAVVEAEQAQRNFVQTLAKTFAQLSTGLAIFDRNRQLVLFNPALIDLTALPAEFLSARPTLFSFFDRLRDQRIMPEPKSYSSWRDQMTELIAAAADGRYQETWSLASGSVYSVSGRPHPDGAIAFLFEDITAEITLTRRFRADLEMQQSIFDRLEDAIAVFSMEGTLTFSNAAYHKLWNVDPESCFAQTSILDSVRIWRDGCMATPVFGDIRDFVAAQDHRAEWWARISLKSGETLFCSLHPIQRGATMITFSRQNVAAEAETQNTPALSAG